MSIDKVNLLNMWTLVTSVKESPAPRQQ
jgi:hypothetical protein